MRNSLDCIAVVIQLNEILQGQYEEVFLYGTDGAEESISFAYKDTVIPLWSSSLNRAFYSNEVFKHYLLQQLSSYARGYLYGNEGNTPPSSRGR